MLLHHVNITFDAPGRARVAPSDASAPCPPPARKRAPGKLIKSSRSLSDGLSSSNSHKDLLDFNRVTDAIVRRFTSRSQDSRLVCGADCDESKCADSYEDVRHRIAEEVAHVQRRAVVSEEERRLLLSEALSMDVPRIARRVIAERREQSRRPGNDTEDEEFYKLVDEVERSRRRKLARASQHGLRQQQQRDRLLNGVMEEAEGDNDGEETSCCSPSCPGRGEGSPRGNVDLFLSDVLEDKEEDCSDRRLGSVSSVQRKTSPRLDYGAYLRSSGRRQLERRLDDANGLDCSRSSETLKNCQMNGVDSRGRVNKPTTSRQRRNSHIRVLVQSCLSDWLSLEDSSTSVGRRGNGDSVAISPRSSHLSPRSSHLSPVLSVDSDSPPESVGQIGLETHSLSYTNSTVSTKHQLGFSSSKDGHGICCYLPTPIRDIGRSDQPHGKTNDQPHPLQRLNSQSTASLIALLDGELILDQNSAGDDIDACDRTNLYYCSSSNSSSGSNEGRCCDPIQTSISLDNDLTIVNRRPSSWPTNTEESLLQDRDAVVSIPGGWAKRAVKRRSERWLSELRHWLRQLEVGYSRDTAAADNLETVRRRSMDSSMESQDCSNNMMLAALRAGQAAGELVVGLVIAPQEEG